jgi:hypothetical protein
MSPRPWQQLSLPGFQQRAECEAAARAVLRYQRIHCRDCGVDVLKIGDWYSVRAEVWAATGLAPEGGVLCLADLRRRLGRPLHLDDFPEDIPINHAGYSRVDWQRAPYSKEILRAIARG